MEIIVIVTIDIARCNYMLLGNGLLVSLQGIESSILIGPYGRFHCCGVEAKQTYERLKSERDTDWSFCQDPFGAMNHCNNKDDLTVRDHAGKEIPAKTVFGLAIRHLKEQSLQQIRHSGRKDVSQNDCVWEFILPPDWSDIAVQTFKKATEIPAHLLSVERKEINICEELCCEELVNEILLSLSLLVNQLQLPNLDEFQHEHVNNTRNFHTKSSNQNQSFHLVYQLVEDLRKQKSSISVCGLLEFLEDILGHLENLDGSQVLRQTKKTLQQILGAVRNRLNVKGYSDHACDMHSITKCKKNADDGNYSPIGYDRQHTCFPGTSEPNTNIFIKDSFHLFETASYCNPGNKRQSD
ncbi:uncharacterized protein LOC128554163 [Mercenaria mercenaria]|uniref:uncharacterized protein LOC128554163 n=1 Tax=Mercenaria mercenaria TaxID=6596 RepID=UPI00234ED38B|nr:uncharacterized protein LOC128554163 [Mercenaria mercenaria]